MKKKNKKSEIKKIVALTQQDANDQYEKWKEQIQNHYTEFNIIQESSLPMTQDVNKPASMWLIEVEYEAY